MSTVLVHLGGATWVNPEDIVAIEWNSARMEECPKLILRNGHRVNATHFQRETSVEPAGDVVERLLRHISRKVAEFGMHPPRDIGRLS